MADTLTLYQAERLFDLPEPYGKDDVKKAYRRLIVEKHPDVRKDVDAETANREASELNAANKLLSKRFEDTPEATYHRQKTDIPKAQPRTTPYPGYSQPRPDVVSWTWTSSMGADEYEIPVDNVTWEDLADDFWEAYHASTVVQRKAEGRSYSYDDLRRDTTAAVFEHLSRSMARAADSWSGGNVQAEPPSPAELARQARFTEYQAEKKRVDRYTGRLAVFIYAHIISALILAAGGLAFPALAPLILLLAVCAVVAGDVNIIHPYATVALRKQPYADLDVKYADLFSRFS